MGNEQKKKKKKVNYQIDYSNIDNNLLISNYLMEGGSNDKTSKSLDSWKHQEGFKINDKDIVENGPVKVFKDIVRDFGNPDIIVNQQNGLCIWNNCKDGIHDHIVLNDEYVDHCVPFPHWDFLYSYIHIYVPPESLSDVLSISGSVGYDCLKHMLWARCGSIEANYATLTTVMKKLNKLSNDDYKENIKNMNDDSENNQQFLKRAIKSNQEKYKEQLDWAYYPGAFPDGCGKK